MKLTEKLKFLLAYWWVMALAVTGISVLVLGNRDGGTSERENRTLQGAPALTVAGLLDGSYQDAVEDYLSDQVPVRNDVLDVSAAVMGVFDVRTGEELILGSTIDAELDDSMEDDEATVETAGAEAEPVGTPEATMTPETQTMEDPAGEDTTAMADATAGADATDGTMDTDDDAATEEMEGGEVPDRDGTDIADTSVIRYFYFTRTDGKTSRIASFGQSAMEAVIKALNAYRAALPEDGTVTFTWIPSSVTANEWLFNTKIYNGWQTDVDETLQANVNEGVYIYSSVNELNAHMQAGEQVFYRTDHHWSGLGAYYMAVKMMESRTVPGVAYYDFTYTTYDNFRGSIAASTLSLYKTKVYDTLEVPGALAPAEAAEYRNLSELVKKVRYMEPERNSYGAFLGGTHGPFFVVETGFHTGRTALIISDSFGNAFFPYLVPYYDRVCQLDLRESYSFVKSGGGSVSEYLEYWGIDDVYFIVSQGKGINSHFMRVNALKYL